MPQFKLKSSAIFLAIKRYQRTKIGEVANCQRSSIKSWCSRVSIAVKLLTSKVRRCWGCYSDLSADQQGYMSNRWNCMFSGIVYFYLFPREKLNFLDSVFSIPRIPSIPIHKSLLVLNKTVKCSVPIHMYGKKIWGKEITMSKEKNGVFTWDR